MENVKSLLHKRILIVEKESGYRQDQKIVEIKILEISPSELFIKIQNMNGNKFWKHSADIIPIEVLSNIESKPTE
jgi:hypothetical protein